MPEGVEPRRHVSRSARGEHHDGNAAGPSAGRRLFGCARRLNLEHPCVDFGAREPVSQFGSIRHAAGAFAVQAQCDDGDETQPAQETQVQHHGLERVVEHVRIHDQIREALLALGAKKREVKLGF